MKINEEFQDIELKETCENCGFHLTLMGSINLNHELWLVKRCLICGERPVEEVYKIRGGV